MGATWQKKADVFIRYGERRRPLTFKLKRSPQQIIERNGGPGAARAPYRGS